MYYTGAQCYKLDDRDRFQWTTLPDLSMSTRSRHIKHNVASLPVQHGSRVWWTYLRYDCGYQRKDWNPTFFHIHCFVLPDFRYGSLNRQLLATVRFKVSHTVCIRRFVDCISSLSRWNPTLKCTTKIDSILNRTWLVIGKCVSVQWQLSYPSCFPENNITINIECCAAFRYIYGGWDNTLFENIWWF